MTVRALVVGSLTMELAFRVPGHPESGEVVAASSFGTHRGGAGYLQAVALARLGAHVSLVAAAGDDDYGDDFAGALGQRGVDARIVRLPESTTAVEVPLIAPDDVAVVLHPAATARFSADLLPELPSCEVLLLQGDVPAATSAEAARRARTAGATVLLDAAPADSITDELLELADVVVAGEGAARALVHGEGPVELDIAAALAGGRRTAVVTSGPRGATYAGPGGSGTAAPPAVEAVDAAGAGAGFCAALAVAIAEGQELADAVRLACTAGALAATAEGAEAGLPSRAAVEDLLAAG